MVDGDPWFVATDVCAALGIVNNRDALEKLDDDERGVGLTDTTEGVRKVGIINESGLYTLILRCRNATKPGTVPHRFRKWVTSEVLPSIRKTGSYQIPNPEIPQAMETVNSADLAKLSQIVYLLKTNFHMEGSASHAAYARLRKEFGLEKGISSLPTFYLDAARGASNGRPCVAPITRHSRRRVERPRSRTSAGTICGTPGRAGTSRLGRYCMCSRSWADGRRLLWSSGMRICHRSTWPSTPRASKRVCESSGT